VAVRAKLAKAAPDRRDLRYELANARNTLGTVLRLAEESDEADDEFAAALAIWKKLAAEPGGDDYANSIAGALVNRACVRHDKRDWPAARRLLEEALPYHRAALR